MSRSPPATPPCASTSPPCSTRRSRRSPPSSTPPASSPAIPLGDTTPEILAAALGAKAAGAAHLDELTAATELDAFVLFSSGAAAWGSGLHGAYAAANAYLDALADSPARPWPGRHLGGLGHVGWSRHGPGARRGRAEAPRPRGDGPAARGQGPCSGARRGRGQPHRRRDRLGAVRPAFTVRRPSQLLTSVPEAVKALGGAGGAAVAATSPASRQSAASWPSAGRLPRDDAGRLLAELVRAEAAAVLGHASPDAVEPGRAFKDLGFDSLTAVELRNRLGRGHRAAAARHPGLRLPHARGARRATCWPSWLGAAAGRRHAAAAAPRPGRRPDEPIAIVGMGCRFPGGVRQPGGAVAAAGRRAATRSPGSRPTAAGTWRGSTTRTPTRPGTTYVARRAGSCTTPADFDAGVLRHHPARGAGDGPAAAAAAGGRLGGARAGRASTRRRCAARRPASSSASMYQRLRRAACTGAGRASRATWLTGSADQRRLRPGRLHLRPGGPGGDRRHRLLLLAGGAAPGLPGAALRASARWRWPAA